MRIRDWSSDGVLFRSRTTTGGPIPISGPAEWIRYCTMSSTVRVKAGCRTHTSIADSTRRHTRHRRIAPAHLRITQRHRAVMHTAHRDSSTEVSIWRAMRKQRSEEHTSELQSLMRISYDVFCLTKKKNNKKRTTKQTHL